MENKKSALISVSDKTGLIDFAKNLEALGYKIISTGGTKKILEENNIKTVSISDITNFPEIMDGRVKTLHPSVHAALLCVRDNDEHIKALEENNIDFIDIVVVNLYPFKEVLKKENSTHEELIENIDIGGPSMLRSAAKNYKYITVLVDSSDYDNVLSEIKQNGDTSFQTREKLAAKVFRHTASYDALIAEYMTKVTKTPFPDKITKTYEKIQDLRYGENSHQNASFYKNIFSGFSICNATQLHGKELSYNNIQDANSALEILKEFDEPTVVAIKHMNPCGVGSDCDIFEAWNKCYSSDKVSIFGGIIALNKKVTKKIANQMADIFLEIIIAPDYDEEAFDILSKSKNIRLLKLDMNDKICNDEKIVSVMDGILIQDLDTKQITKNDMNCVTNKKPTENEIEDMLFAWKVVKHVKSNAIVIVKNKQTIGIGAGQMNRVGSAKIALEQAGELAKNSVLASDAFFPMPDTVEIASKYGIKAIIQTGGSIKDNLSIEECNKNNISMVFTNIRHFKH